MNKFTVRDLINNGFIRREDLDFKDDGNSFRGYEYNGLTLTYLKSNGEYYIALRVDYLKGLNYNEYSKMESYELADEFNGVSEVDVIKLKENAEIILEEYNEKLKEVSERVVDIVALVEQANKELLEVKQLLGKAKVNIFELEINNYILKNIIEYGNSLLRIVTSQKERLESGDHSEAGLRQIEDNFKERGYLTDLSDNSFYVRSIKEFINKYVK